ncbi:RTC4-like domain-containing protein [Immersiella caudata]|uniref:Restriction of telomere capping protein 4 n=1 Tax=Immersiella caudata TaxID=314043 RepID=A0AA40CCA4_9PEZI|nr:RTC4-like domain-containing protein [Immersiella caudata]
MPRAQVTSAAARRTGLSRHQAVPPLLSVFKNDDKDKESDIEDPAPRREEPAVDAPPLEDSDSSDGLPGRGDIQRSQFRSQFVRPPRYYPRRTNNDDEQTAGISSPARYTLATKNSARSSRRDAGTKAEESTETPSEKASEESSYKEDPDQTVKEEREALGAHFNDNLDQAFAKNAEQRTVQCKKRITFGRAPYRPLSTISPTGRVSPNKEFMTPKELSPQKDCGTPSTKRTLQLPGATPKTKTSSQEGTVTSSRRLKVPNSPTKINEEGPSHSKRKLEGSVERQASKHARPRKAKPEPEPEPALRPVLKIPELFSSSFEFGEDSAFLDDVEETLPACTNRSFSPLSEATTPTSSRPMCPMCDEVVDVALLAQFKAKRRHMTLQEEQQFCVLHKRASAKKAWLDNGYPDISWSGLEARINKQHRFLREILEGGRSHFGEIFREKVKTGQNKTLLKSEESLTPGYYGGRGLRAMSENLVNKFSSLLRRRAVEDRLVSARGHTAYVQSVLVPELTVRLIMEDMQVDAEEARSIMATSKWVGELLNEEVADIVLGEDEEESGSELSSCPDTDGP